MAIFGNIREMVGVQRRFLRSLEAALESSSAIESINQIQNPSEFKVSSKNNSNHDINRSPKFSYFLVPMTLHLSFLRNSPRFKSNLRLMLYRKKDNSIHEKKLNDSISSSQSLVQINSIILFLAFFSLGGESESM